MDKERNNSPVGGFSMEHTYVGPLTVQDVRTNSTNAELALALRNYADKQDESNKTIGRPFFDLDFIELMRIAANRLEKSKFSNVDIAKATVAVFSAGTKGANSWDLARAALSAIGEVE